MAVLKSKKVIDKNEIPSSWAIATFEDLLDYIQPTNYIVESTEYDDRYKTPVLTAGKSFIIGYTNEKNGIFNSLPTIIFDDFTTATQFVNFPFKVKSSAMKILQSNCDLVNIKFAYYFMQTVHIKSETHKRYWISEYSKLPIPLPSFKEQHRIVEKIEELFTELDKGIETLKTAQQQFKVYRQAVLKWAFEGKLTNPPAGWAGENVNGELPKGWKWVKLGKVSEITSSKRIFQHEYVSNGIPFYRTKEIKELSEGKAVSTDLFISETKYQEIKSRFSIPKKGDVLLSAVGTIGISYVVKNDMPFYFKDGNLMWFKDLTEITPYFLSYGLTNFIRNKKGAKTSGSAYNALTIETMKEFDFPLPSKKEEQTKIVHEIESRLSVCDKIEETIESNLKQAQALRQSILKKAFEGRLVPQNPKDEPAAKLLARIRAEKEKNKPAKNPKARKKESA